MRGVGTHVGDQAGLSASAAQVDAFVEALRDAHRALKLEPEPVGGGLLHRAGDERAGGLAGRALGGDRVDQEVGRILADVPEVLAEVLGGAFALRVFFFDRVVELKAELLRDVERQGAVVGLEGFAVELDQLGLEAGVVAEPGVLLLDRRGLAFGVTR